MWLLELHKDLPDNPTEAMVSIREEGAMDGWFDGGGGVLRDHLYLDSWLQNPIWSTGIKCGKKKNKQTDSWHGVVWPDKSRMWICRVNWRVNITETSILPWDGWECWNNFQDCNYIVNWIVNTGRLSCNNVRPVYAHTHTRFFCLFLLKLIISFVVNCQDHLKVSIYNWIMIDDINHISWQQKVQTSYIPHFLIMIASSFWFMAIKYMSNWCIKIQMHFNFFLSNNL